MIPFFSELFEYSHHFNQQLIGRLMEQPDKAFEKSILLQSHIVNAHQIWNSRLLKKKQAVGVWDIRPLAVLREQDKQNYEDSLRILQTVDLSELVAYVNSQGQTFSNTARDILFHAINHSTHHRAQIVTECKQNGMDPLITDYIFYKR